MAVGGAALLIVSAHLNERVQARTALAYETQSTYFELSGAIFRTFKQVRRDLVSGDGRLAADFQGRRAGILSMIDRIETVSETEAELMDGGAGRNVLEDVTQLRAELIAALDAIDQAAALISSGARADGRALAISVLEGQVDVRIASLMDDAIALEREQLEAARSDLRRFHSTIQLIAWALVVLVLLATTLIVVSLVRRFGHALGRLTEATQAYAEDKLDQRINLDGQDELSDVARRMESMADQILTKQQALEKIRAELEQRVVDRTAELSSVNRELEKRERLRRQFFADIGHELRTPVTAIRGEAEVALRAREDRPVAQEAALNQIVALTSGLTNSVNDLFLLAREQAGMLDFRNVVLDLNEPARQAVGEMRALIEAAEASVHLELADADVWIEGELSRLVQLVRLLVSNALTHCPRGVEISVRTRANGTRAMLCIADNGPGVPAEDRGQIFNRYTRGKEATARSASGTGLGLSIAKSIVNAHGGTIEVTEASSGGAEFQASFPMAETAG